MWMQLAHRHMTKRFIHRRALKAVPREVSVAISEAFKERDGHDR
jgi:hypothetical protein